MLMNTMLKKLEILGGIIVGEQICDWIDSS
jgi:hypothetical protein